MKRWPIPLALCLLIAGCSANLRLQVGNAKTPYCPEYRPPVQEMAPQGLGVDALPYDFSEAVALALGNEVKMLRDYIARRDARDRKAMEEYRLGCQKAGKSVQGDPS